MAIIEHYLNPLQTSKGIFLPNEESALKLLGAALMDINELWATGKRYLNTAEYLSWRNKQGKTESAGESKSKK